MDEIERRLVAVLNADMAGFTRLMADDSIATVRAVAALRQHVDARVAAHRGRLVDFVGDNFLAEFQSALGATQCALELQRSLEERNAALDPAQRPEIRIGVHLGDVIAEGARIYGDAVNVAGRLQALAVAGGICISGVVRDQVHRQVHEPFEDLGARWLKNFPEAVRVFRVGTGVGTEGAERRLAVMMACDAAGYTRLTARDELGAFETIVSLLDLLVAIVRRFRGRVIDTVGDGMFAEFPTATEAVGCALEIKATVEERNLRLAGEQRLALRIGIHLDEVIVRGERLYGQGVNAVHNLAVAARPGEICVSQPVYEHIQGKLEVEIDDRGELSLPALPRPIRIHSVTRRER